MFPGKKTGNIFQPIFYLKWNPKINFYWSSLWRIKWSEEISSYSQRKEKLGKHSVMLLGSNIKSKLDQEVAIERKCKIIPKFFIYSSLLRSHYFSEDIIFSSLLNDLLIFICWIEGKKEFMNFATNENCSVVISFNGSLSYKSPTHQMFSLLGLLILLITTLYRFTCIVQFQITLFLITCVLKCHL